MRLGNTLVRTQLVALLMLVSIGAGRAKADPVYTVTDLGAYSPPFGRTTDQFAQVAEEFPVRIDQTGGVTTDRLGFGALDPTQLAAVQGPYAAGRAGLYPALKGSVYQVGYVSSTDSSSAWQALVWNGKTGQALGLAPPTRLGDLAHYGWFSIATGVNDRGHVVGSGGSDAQSRSALTWGLTSDGSDPLDRVRTQLGSYSDAFGINNKDQIVGAFHGATDPRAFLFSGGKLIDLNGAIPLGSGLTLVAATGINDAGQIVGVATNASGQARDFLLTPDLNSPTPVPEPGSLAVFGLACLALGVKWSRRNQV